MTNVLIERAENAWLLIIQDAVSGKRKVISIAFEGDVPGYTEEANAIRLLTGITVE